MSWNGAGSYVLPPATFPEVNGTVVDATRFNATLLDVQAGITAALAKNGENTPTANLGMGGFKHTGAASAVAAGQYLTWGQDVTVGALTVNGGTVTWPGTATHSGDHVFSGSMTVNGNAAFGNAAGDTLAFASSTVTWSNNPTHSGNHSFTGVMGQAAGAVGAPALYPIGDTNTGRWYPAPDTVAESVGGSELLRWSATGFGVGVTPATTFHVKGSGEVARIETTTARGSGNGYLVFHDPTGTKGYLGYTSGSTDSFAVYNLLNADILFGTNGFTRARFLAAGHFVPELNNSYDSGSSALRWKKVWAVDLDVSGTGGNVYSGTYTPVATDVSGGFTSITPSVCQFMRVGGVVTVSGHVAVNYSVGAAPANLTFRMSLPVASDFSADEQCAGTGLSEDSTPIAVRIYGDAATNEAFFGFTVNDTNDLEQLYFHFTYRIA